MTKLEALRKFLKRVVKDKTRTFDNFAEGCKVGRVGLAEEILSEYLTEPEATNDKR